MNNSLDLPPTDPTMTAEKPFSLWRLAGEVIETVVLAVVLFVGINVATARIRVDGSSMEPTFYDGEYVLVNRLAYRLGSLSRGDVVIFYLPDQPKRDYIKRVIGLPGDRVEVSGREVRVNGELIQEDYIAASPTYTGVWTVPEGSAFVLGDNRNNSTDSHNWGAIPIRDIMGRAILIYWPPAHWDIIESVAWVSGSTP
jgi:signal peptidase I